MFVLMADLTVVSNASVFCEKKDSAQIFDFEFFLCGPLHGLM